MFFREEMRGIHYLLELLKERIREIHHRFPHRAHSSRLTIQFYNFKISSSMAKFTFPTGTPVTGSASPLDAKNNVLPVSAYKAGSVKWSVADGSGFSVAPGATEEDFALTETDPGSGSKGTLLLDAQDVDGNALPQASADFEFTEIPAKAVASQINVDQTSH